MTAIKSNADYAFWRAALRGERQDVGENDPKCGFYRRRNGKDSPWYPAAIWRNADGIIVCGFQGKLIEDPTEISSIWTWLAKNPIEEAVYRGVAETGIWPDGATSEPAQRLSNEPEDPFILLKEQLSGKLENAENLLKTAPNKITKVEADRARNLEAEIAKLRGQADLMFEAEKAPARAEATRIDDKYRFRASADATGKKMKGFYEAWQKTERLRLEAEAQMKFEEDRQKAAEAARAIEEERARLEREDPIMAVATDLEPWPVFPSAPEPVKAPMVGGGVGNRAGFTVKYDGRIVDMKLCLAHFAGHHEIAATLEKLVKDAVKRDKQSTNIPGVDIYDNLGRKVGKVEEKAA